MEDDIGAAHRVLERGEVLQILAHDPQPAGRFEALQVPGRSGGEVIVDDDVGVGPLKQPAQTRW